MREGGVANHASRPRVLSLQLQQLQELLRAMMMEQDATRRVLVRKGLLTDLEVLEEIKAVRREMEGKRGR